MQDHRAVPDEWLGRHFQRLTSHEERQDKTAGLSPSGSSSARPRYHCLATVSPALTLDIEGKEHPDLPPPPAEMADACAATTWEGVVYASATTEATPEMNGGSPPALLSRDCPRPPRCRPPTLPGRRTPLRVRWMSA